MKAAGVVGVVRYQWIESGQRPQFNRDKAITKAEYDGLRGAGLAVALVCQVDKDNYLRGYQEGLRHGGLSLQHSRSMGHPDSCLVYLAVQDQSIPVANYPLAVEYMHGFKDGRGLGPQLMYGGTNVGNLCVNAGHAKGIWQSAASSWSTQASAFVVLEQLSSKSYPQFPPLAYDENHVHKVDWGQSPQPNAPQPPQQEEPPMAFVTKNAGGSTFVVAADLSSKAFIAGADFNALKGAGYKEVVLDFATLDRVALLSDLQAKQDKVLSKLDALILAVSKIGTDLTPEQIAALAAAVGASVKDTVDTSVRGQLDKTKLAPS
jgi:hypothetical protein